MGTCLVGKDIVSSAPHIFNMHTGLSPYYRGGETNMWPIIEEDYGYFGVTIHKMSLGIDSGDIIFSKQPEIYPDDTYGKINSRCIKIGTCLMIKAIHNVTVGRVKGVKQWTKGKLFNDRDLNHYIAYKYFKKRDVFLKTYCYLKERNLLNDIKTVEDDSMDTF
jgi:methionyl-tRNA formyltransferase